MSLFSLNILFYLLCGVTHCLHIGNDDTCSHIEVSNNLSTNFNGEVECLEQSSKQLVLDFDQLATYVEEENVFKLTIKYKVFIKLVSKLETNLSKSLVNLTLTYNKIELLEHDSFTFLVNLNSLNLFENKLNTIEVGSFQNPNKLR